MLVKAWVIPLVCLDFEIRRDYIVKNLCVNRNRPQLHCDGKCYLAKKLAETEKQQQRQAEQDYLASLIYQVMDTNTQNFFSVQPSGFELPLDLVFQYNSVLSPRNFPNEIFHPPLAV
ncbi:hypothetical protein Dfri01_38730 [Dyadobacter frigoris]|uniref:Uncharacterized protein n=2 Tax=Dyadobacter frigoris TaxID=2576211 RepID=A0A4U6D9L4_9BACT|nr:hypothetical protein FDK13_08490 [Dyadobacter frigoris]GLU54412.1 hypothetical protein Dfri01_38730 [Dyadobacter frigoris]